MLKVRNLIKVYPGPVTALQGVSLEIDSGMFGLLGPNGAGKSTLMRILAGLLEPTSGSVYLDDIDIVASPEKLWPKLGYLPQEFGFYPHLTGQQMLEHLLKLKGVEGPNGTKKLALDLLERVHLADAATRKVKGYSGGMRQRLGIAQAIAGNPRLIIVDEPTAGLDPEERYRFYRILAEIARDRIVLLSTHIVEDVAVLCSRFAIVKSGRIVALTTPANARIELAGLVFEGAAENHELEELSRRTCILAAVLSEGKNRVRIYCKNGVAPAGFDPTIATLEDAYLLRMRLQTAGVSEAAAESAL